MTVFVSSSDIFMHRLSVSEGRLGTVVSPRHWFEVYRFLVQKVTGQGQGVCADLHLQGVHISFGYVREITRNANSSVD